MMGEFLHFEKIIKFNNIFCLAIHFPNGLILVRVPSLRECTHVVVVNQQDLLSGRIIVTHGTMYS